MTRMDESSRRLPVADILMDVVHASRSGAVVVTAPPGSGKTSLVPPAVMDDLASRQKTVLIQPRRIAARAIARRIAYLRGAELGGEVGYQVRFDSRVSRDTRLVVVTTGILLRRLLDDIALEDVGCVVIDEFHERSVEMDLVLGLLARIRDTLKPELRIVVMSATLASGPVAQLLGGCPVIPAEARQYPIHVHYTRRGERKPLQELVVKRLPETLRETAGHILVFLPGVGEILRCKEALAPLAERHSCALLPLFGDLPIEEQDRALADLGMRKIILATNVAETSLTIDGVTAVIDSGQARQRRVSEATGLPRLELVPISQASAEQRRGVPAVPVPASAGGCGTSHRITRGQSPRRPKYCAAISPNRSCCYAHWVNWTSFPGSMRHLATPSRTPSVCSFYWARSMTANKSLRSEKNCHAFRPIHGWRDCFWQGQIAVYCARHPSPLRCFPSATPFGRPSTAGAVRATIGSFAADRMLSTAWPRSRHSIPAMFPRIRRWRCIRSAHEMCLKQPTSYFTSPTFHARRGPKILSRL